MVERYLKVSTKLMILVIVCALFLNVQKVSASSGMNYDKYILSGHFSVYLKVNGSSKATWYSTNPKVAKVSSKGKVSSVANGKCTIYAKTSRGTYKCKIVVKDVKKPPANNYTKTTVDVTKLKLDVSGISYDKDGNAIVNAAKKNTFKLSLLNIPEKNGKKMKVKWKSTNNAIATVSSKGTITPITAGTCNVIATVKKKNYKCNVTVTNIERTSTNHYLGDKEGAAEVIDRQTQIYKQLKLINQARVSARVKPLVVMDKLVKAAQIRSGEIVPKEVKPDHTGLAMLLDNRFCHVREDGTTYSSVLGQVGLPTPARFSGENLERDTVKVTSLQDCYEIAYNVWYANQYHKANMLNKNYEYVGIGYFKAITFYDESGRGYVDYFWTQEFYTK